MCSRYATLCHRLVLVRFCLFEAFLRVPGDKKGRRPIGAEVLIIARSFKDTEPYEPRMAGADSFSAVSLASASFAADSLAAASLAAFAAADRAPRPESKLNCRILYRSAL